MYNCCSVYNPPSGSGGSAVTGSGTLNYLSKWTPSGTVLGDSQIFDDGTSIGVNTTTLTFFFNIEKVQNANTTLNVLNSNAGASSRAAITATSEDNSLSLNAYSSAFSNTYLRNNAVLFGGKRALRIISDADGAGSGSITFGIGSGTPTGEFASVNSSGNWSFYGPAGSPSGTARLNIVGTPTYNTIEATGGGSTTSTFTAIFQNSSLTAALQIRDDSKVFVGAIQSGAYDADDKLIVRGTIVSRNGSSALYLYNDGTAAGLFRYNYGTAAYQNFAIGNTTTQLNLMGRVHFSNTATSTSIKCSIYAAGSDDALTFVGGNNTQNGFRFNDSTDTTAILTLYDDGTLTAKQAAISTSATDGFWYVPSCEGTPTGVPTVRTGTVPIVVDSTNNKFYMYSGGAWVALN